MFSRFLVVSIIFLSACVHPPQTTKFKKGKPVQTIEVARGAYLYAQNDVLLDSSLNKTLRKENKDWEKEIKKHNVYKGIANSAAIVQLITLIGCLSVDSKDDDSSDKVLAWCGTSIGAGLLSFNFGIGARKRQQKVVSEYNKTFADRIEESTKK